MRGNFSLLRRLPRRLMSISFPAMATASRKNSAPHTFDLPLSLIAKIHAVRKVRRLKTATAVVRLAIEEFDFEGCVLLHEPHRQISVRITAAQRAMVKRYAQSKDSSVGELVRLALENLSVRPARSRARK